MMHDMAGKLKILFVEDVLTDAELIWREIENNKIHFSKIIVDKKDNYLEYLKDFEPDLIISDYSLPQFDGMTALRLRNELAPMVPFILVTGSINEEVAVECMKAGADDYILKDNLSRLGPAILNSVRKSQLFEDKIEAEKELQNSETRLRKAQSIAHIGNWELDFSTQSIWASDEAFRIYGLDAKDHNISYELVKKIVLPEYRGILDEALDKLLKYNESYDVEFKIKRANDNTIRSIYSLAELVLEQGEKVKVVGIIQDITDRRTSEAALNESEEKFHSIMENSADAIFITDQKGRYVYTNKAVTEMLGFTSDEMKSKTILDISPANKKDEYLNIFRAILSEGSGFTEIELLKKDGNFIASDLNAVLLPDGMVYASCRDITERKQSEEILEQERKMLRILIDNLPDPIYVQDKECRKVIANKADVENIGCESEEEVLGKTDIELFPGKIGERGYADDKKIIETGKPIFDLEEEFVSAKGLKRWLLTTKIPLLDKDGNVTGLVGIGHDITERKQIMEELISSKEKAEESDKLKTAFLHNISHEIRTPMNAIVGFSALLGEPEIDDNSRKSYIDVIMQSSNHLLSIITDIVDISNIEANLIKTVKNEINLNSTLKSLCNQFFPKAYDKKILLECETQLTDPDSFILTDRTKLTQILSNLVSNALKFTDKGSIKVSYTLRDKLLEFSVADTGIGIPQLYHERVFDRFYQVQSNVSRLYEGTGLGLAISKAYVEHLGGRIWLTSEQGKGTTFSFTIPYEKQLSLSVELQEKKAPDTYVFPERKVILVAEDIESNFKLIKYFLAGSNTEVLHASNGREAVDKCLSNGRIDLILMDIKMPVMDGYSAVKLIREKNNEVPIIAQTAYADDRERAIECGCSGFISKPFDKKGLFKVLCEFI
jgi:PAS domain S-box-containing protein